MFDQAKVAKEVFSTLRSFNYEVAAFDEEGNKVYEPESATRFFTDKKNITVSLDEDGENSVLRVLLGRSAELLSVQGLLDTLRRCATKFGILFNTRKYRRELMPKDFANGPVLESKALSGSTKTSYLKLEGARMIVRHDGTVDDSKQGARGRNVKKIMVENNEGERFLMPSTNMMAGRAMTRHVSKGGHWSDDVGTKISEMARQQKHLKTCASYCRKNKNKLDEDVDQIVDVCRSRVREMRETFEGLYRNYDKKCEELLKEPETLLNEEDEGALNERVDALKKKLQLEDESIMDREGCESVARVLEGVLSTEPKADLQKLPALGAEVEKAAWDAFKNDKTLNLKGEIESVDGEDDTARLRRIAQNVSDEKMAAMLTSVAEKIENGDSSALLTMIARSALEAGQSQPKADTPSPVVDEEQEMTIKLPKLGGIEVETKAWEGLKAGKIDITGPLEFPIPSTSTNRAVSQLHAVIRVCANHSLANVLERVADDIDLGRALPLHNAIAQAAIKACMAASKGQASTGKSVSLDEGQIIMTESVREFGDWIDSFSATRLLREGFGDDAGPRSSVDDDEYSRLLDQAIGDSIDEFDVDDFLVTKGDDFNYGDNDIEREVEASYLMTSLKSYLNQQVETHLSGGVFVSHDDFGDLTSQASGLIGQVISRLEAEGYTVTGQDALETDDVDNLDIDADLDLENAILDEKESESLAARAARLNNTNRNYGDFEHLIAKDDEEEVKETDEDGLDDNTELLLGGEENELSPEDILLPSNPQSDFVNDVTVDDTDDEINRLLALAGQRRSEQPDQKPVP